MTANKKFILSDWPRIDAMSDAEVDYSDAPDTDLDFWEAAVVNSPRVKKQVTLCNPMQEIPQ